MRSNVTVSVACADLLSRGALLQEEEFRRSGGRAVLLFYERIGTWTDTAV